MKVAQQSNQVSGILEKLLESGRNYHIFIDIKRSQVTYFKYVANKDMIKINFREYENGRKIKQATVEGDAKGVQEGTDSRGNG